METTQVQSQPQSAEPIIETTSIEVPSEESNLRTIKINGEETQVSLDDIKRGLNISEWDPKFEKALIQAYQIKRAGDHAFNEVDKTRKQVEADKKRIEYFNELLIANPEGILEELGLADKLDEMSFNRIRRRFEIEQMTPEQREAYEAKLERDQEKSEREKYQKRVEKFEYEQQVSAHIENESQEMIEAVKRSSLPQDRQTLQMMATYMLAGYTAQQAVHTLESRLPSLVDMWLQSATPEQIGKMLSKEARNKVQQFQIGQVKQKPTNQAPPPGTLPVQKPKQGPYGESKRERDIEAAQRAFESFTANRQF